MVCGSTVQSCSVSYEATRMKRIRPLFPGQDRLVLDKAKDGETKKKKKNVFPNPPLDSESCSICVTQMTVGIFDSLPASF